MSDQKLKNQRDRFLAFSFASADLFIEMDANGVVTFALGAAKGLSGISDKALIGRNWLDLFSMRDRRTLTALMDGRAQPGQRCGPYHVKMDDMLCGGREAIVTAIKMPDRENFYVTVGFLNDLMVQMAKMVREQEEHVLLDKDTFLHAAQESLDLARTMGREVDMTLLDIPEAQKVKERVGDDNWNKLTKSITGILGTHSIDGHAAAQIAEGRYSVIHDKNINSDTLRFQIEELSKQADPEGNGVEVGSKTVTSDLQSLSEREASKALVYTINEFERKGAALNIDTLNTGFKAYVSANAHKIHQFKTMIEQLSFDLYFHPIVDMKTLECSHFEMLSRFRGGGSTQEWVIFGEDIGMAPDFDIAVCERAINYLLYKSSGRRSVFAINLSGQSIQNEQFFKTLMAKLSLHKDLAQRLIFEITESTTITQLEMVNKFIKILQAAGYRICLDDFGTGSGSFQYLQQLDVDYIKINGLYTKKILESERDKILIKNLVRMCNDLNITTIAEKVELKKQADTMKELGVAMGQGYFFATPGSKPDYDPASVGEKPAPPAKPTA